RDRLETQAETFLAVLAVVLLTSPSTNPQFIVWVLPFVVLAWGAGHGLRVELALLSSVPVLFYLAQWAGNPLSMLTPAISYFSWPVAPPAAAHSLARSLQLVGPGGIALRTWMMFVVAAA